MQLAALDHYMGYTQSHNKKIFFHLHSSYIYTFNIRTYVTDSFTISTILCTAKMSMNPKNILNLLCNSFDQPQYNIKTIITNEERSFASQLEELIKNAIDKMLFRVFLNHDANEPYMI